MSTMSENFQYYLDNKEELIRKYSGKYLVISSCKVVKVFSSKFSAVEFATKKFEPKAFIVQQAKEGADIQVFHTRVAFA